MRRRGKELGVDPEKSAQEGRTDEFARIAQILRDMSETTGTTAAELAAALGLTIEQAPAAKRRR